MKTNVAGQMDDMAVSDKDNSYMKELERNLVDEDEQKRREKEKKDAALAKQLEKEETPIKKNFIQKRKFKSSKKIYKRTKKG